MSIELGMGGVVGRGELDAAWGSGLVCHSSHLLCLSPKSFPITLCILGELVFLHRRECWGFGKLGLVVGSSVVCICVWLLT